MDTISDTSALIRRLRNIAEKWMGDDVDAVIELGDDMENAVRDHINT